MPTVTAALPHWDMTTVYPSLESPEFDAAFRAIDHKIDDLVRLFDAKVRPTDQPPAIDAELVATFDTVVQAYNGAHDDLQTLFSYISQYLSVDSRNHLAQARGSVLRQCAARLFKLDKRFAAWVGSLDTEALLTQSAVARDHAHALKRAKIEAAHLMSPAEEDLAADMALSGGWPWGKLHGDITSQVMVAVEMAGETRELPMSAVRNLAMEPDRDLRRRAYEAELTAWKLWATPLAASLNSIKGEHNTLSLRRGWSSPLEESLFQNAIDRSILDALLGAARTVFPDLQRYLRLKARLLGVPRLAWYDLFAPVGKNPTSWEWDRAVAFITDQFGTYSGRMRGLAERAFEERWIDAEPRPGKQDGGFCMPLHQDVSRILVNYTAAYDGVSTLAHELGHAYHNLNEATLTPLQRATPMTLAETASTFCETILRQAALKRASAAEQLAIIETALVEATQVVLDISSRFLFEQRVFERRRERELSTDEFCELMLDAQRETYGDGLDPDLLHPYMWAVKGHYYSSSRAFYNYPYLFGLLFGLGLYAQYETDPDTFRAGYDDLLASTGQADAADLAARFGIDIRTPAFWQSSLDVIRADVNRFEELIGTVG